MSNKLLVPTIKGGTWTFKTGVSDTWRVKKGEPPFAFLIVLPSSVYCKDNRLWCGEQALTKQEIFDLGALRGKENLLKYPLLPYALFSFLYYNKDLRNESRFTFKTSEFVKYMSWGRGSEFKRFKSQILSLHDVHGFIDGIGVMPFLDYCSFDEEKKEVTIVSKYLNVLLNNFLVRSSQYGVGAKGRYYSKHVSADAYSSRSTLAVQIVLEIVRRLDSVKSRRLRISLTSFAKQIPELDLLINNGQQLTSHKNQQLKRVFSLAFELLREYTDCYQVFKDLKLDEINFSHKRQSDILTISHKGYVYLEDDKHE